MRPRLLPALAALLAAVPAARADDAFDRCVTAAEGVMPTMGECGGEWMERADARLNAEWKRLNRLDLEPEQKQALLREQRAWLAYRDAACDIYGDEANFGQNGRYLFYPNCKAQLIEKRVEDLRGYIQAIDP